MCAYGQAFMIAYMPSFSRRRERTARKIFVARMLDRVVALRWLNLPDRYGLVEAGTFDER